MSISVIIPTKNRLDDLENLLKSIEKQTISPDEVIIVDQSDEDYGQYIQNQFINLNIIYYRDINIKGLCNAKNIGVNISKSEIVSFFDDDLILNDDFIYEVKKTFENNIHIVGMCGKQINSSYSKFRVSIFEFFNKGPYKDVRKRINSGHDNYPDIVKVDIISGGITAYKRSIFEVYKFDENLVKYCLGEDVDFSYRVSRNNIIVINKNLRAIHNHSIKGRYNSFIDYESRVCFYKYFYKKNLTQTLVNYLFTNWAILGIGLDAIRYSIKNKDRNSIRGVVSGISKSKHGFRDVTFIEIK